MRKKRITPEDEVNFRPDGNPTSYVNIGITEQKWARTGVPWWVNILVVLFWVVVCLALNMACWGYYYGWDNLFRGLGWTK
jgi:hypothetical protein